MVLISTNGCNKIYKSNTTYKNQGLTTLVLILYYIGILFLIYKYSLT